MKQCSSDICKGILQPTVEVGGPTLEAQNIASEEFLIVARLVPNFRPSFDELL